MKVAVVGGGIAGLAAAWELRDEADVTLYEPGRLGGCIRTSELVGRPIDEGPDAFITRSPFALELCRELGIEGELVAPTARRAAIWWRGALRELPGGLVMGAPGNPFSLLKTGILTPAGIGRAALDLLLPRRRLPESPTVRDVIGSRFGREVADRLVDPLVGSIYAGSTASLGAAETVPQILSVAQNSRSLMVGLGRRADGPDTSPAFLAPRAGMGHLVDAMVPALFSVRFLSERVERIRPSAGSQLRIEPGEEAYDAVVLATPAGQAARVLGEDAPPSLAGLPTASVVLLTAVLQDIDLPAGLSGFLVPRNTGRLLTACSFGSRKWPHWATGEESVVRLSAGRYDEPGAVDLDDETVGEKLIQELCEALGRTANVVAMRITRWPNSFPQYLPGHESRVIEAEAGLSRFHPGVHLAGSSYRGIGIPACIASGRRAARLAVASAKAHA